MADNINVSERNTLPVHYNINVSTVILPPRQHYIYIYIYIYVRVASRNRTLAHIPRFEKMADEVGATKNRLYWFT